MNWWPIPIKRPAEAAPVIQPVTEVAQLRAVIASRPGRCAA
jgi:hypothetical protein